jgi:hypothetical protein
MTPQEIHRFVELWEKVSNEVHGESVKHGFWKTDRGEVDRNVGEAIALIHSELSEALEAFRNGNSHDSALTMYGGVEVELADVIIRIMDLSTGFRWRVIQALFSKMEYNAIRAYRHGKDF